MRRYASVKTLYKLQDIQINLFSVVLQSTSHVLAVLPSSFKLAFSGKESELAKKIDISSTGLLSQLMDKQIISRNQRELVEVSA